MLSLIRLTRPVNLLIIALTMALMRYVVLRPAVEANGFELQQTGLEFALLVLATILVAAGGNIINDYFDQRIDRVNRPRQVLVGVHVKRRWAMVSHLVLSGAGIVLAGFVAWKSGIPQLALIHALSVGLLWFYSTNFKRQLLVGNVVVAVLTGLVPLLVGIYEIPQLLRTYGHEVRAYFEQYLPDSDPSEYFLFMFYLIAGYAIFAFWLNLIREIQKDMADVPGDLEAGCRTIPIAWGLSAARTVVLGLVFTGAASLYFVYELFLANPIVLAYLVVCVMVPLLWGGWLSFKARKRSEHVRAANLTKWAMLGGLLYAFVHQYVFM